VRLVLLGRSRSNAEGTIADVQCVSPETKVEWVDVNLDSIASVREAASKVEKALAAGDKIDGLVGNAAIMAVPYALTGDGIERHFQTNHLSHWLLVNLLLSKGLISDHDSRIVLVTSGIRPAQAPSVEDIRDWSFQVCMNVLSFAFSVCLVVSGKDT
jgi:NAD(P)-dependent dehydrogenase (short-subunit alcohol dehydrogenase family)